MTGTTISLEPLLATPPPLGGVEARLKAAWRRETRFHLLRGLALILPCGTGLALADFFLDWGFNLRGYVRAALLLLNLAVLGWIIWTQYWRRTRRYSSVILALRVETAHPELDNLLVSAVQLNEEQLREDASPELVRAIKRQALERTGKMDFGQIVDLRKLRAPAIAAGVALLVLMASVAARPRHAWTLLCRIANPWTTLAYPTRTAIEVLSGNLEVRQTDPVRLEARAAGEIPAQGILLVNFAGAGWERIELTRQGQRDFRHTFEQTSGSFEYLFRLGDATSRTYRVTAVRPPQIVEGNVKLVYPAYTHLAAETTQNLNLKVPENTSVNWQLKFDRAITKAELLLENHAPIPMTLANERTANLSVPAEASSSYRFRFTWPLKGLKYLEEEPAHFMRVIPDVDPRAELLYPMEDEKATLDKIMTLKFQAQNNYGLDKATIVYAVNDGAEQKGPAVSLEGQLSVEREITWPLRSTLPGLKEGDVLTFAVLVADGRASQPGVAGHVARTKSHRVQFVSAKEYLKYVLSRQRKYLGQIRPLYAHERDAAEHMREIAPPTDKAANPPATRKAAEEDASK